MGRESLSKGDDVTHTLTGTRGTVRHVFKKDIEVLFWSGNKAIIQWEPKRHWVRAQPEGASRKRGE